MKCSDCDGTGIVIEFLMLGYECSTCQGHGGLCDGCGLAAEYCECVVPMDEDGEVKP